MTNWKSLSFEKPWLLTSLKIWFQRLARRTILLGLLFRQEHQFLDDYGKPLSSLWSATCTGALEEQNYFSNTSQNCWHNLKPSLKFKAYYVCFKLCKWCFSTYSRTLFDRTTNHSVAWTKNIRKRNIFLGTTDGEDGQSRQIFGRSGQQNVCQIYNRKKWQTGQTNTNINEVVIIKQENTPPTLWSMGK